MNKAESEALALGLQKAGWTAAEQSREADCIILNTCSVRKTAENRIRGRIGYYKHMKSQRKLKLAVIGCMSERLQKDLFNEIEAIDLLVGTFQKHKIPGALEELMTTDERCLLTEKDSYSFDITYSSGGFKAFVPIMHGCNNYCSYCIVPFVRGKEVSRAPRAIIDELEKLDARGVKEVTLLGQNVNSYLYRNGESTVAFSSLLQLLLAHGKRIEWIRFLTSHPKDLSNDLIHVIADSPRLCRHIHLPVQHGSTRILKAMNRGYTRDDYLVLIDKIKNCISDVSLTTDILIGFPGEEEEDFRQTIDLMKKVRFDNAFTYRYNPREGTKAFDFEDTVDEELKLKRLSEVIDLQRTISRQEKEKRLGRQVKVLIESLSKKNRNELLGRTEWDEMVVFKGDAEKIGSMAIVDLVSLNGLTFHGKEVY
jgi:tRNA-2-methylthio-N6-dimethylallyladenosine synthase